MILVPRRSNATCRRPAGCRENTVILRKNRTGGPGTTQDEHCEWYLIRSDQVHVPYLVPVQYQVSDRQWWLTLFSLTNEVGAL